MVNVFGIKREYNLAVDGGAVITSIVEDGKLRNAMNPELHRRLVKGTMTNFAMLLDLFKALCIKTTLFNTLKVDNR